MIKRLFILIAIIFFVFLSHERTFSAGQTESSEAQAGDHQIYVPNELIVKTLPDMSASEFSSLNKANGATVMEGSSISGLYRLKIAKPVEKAIFYQANPAVKYAKPNYIFAEIGKGHITVFDLEFTIQRFIPILRQRYAQMQFKEELLNILLHDKLYAQAARDENLQDTPELQREIKEALEKTLSKNYQKSIKAGALSEEEMRNYYENNKSKFYESDQIRGQRILVKSKQEAEEILGLLKTGADFGAIAREKSIDPTGKKGGSFGWLGRGTLPAAVEDEVFALQKEEISVVVPTQSGSFIIKVLDKKAARQVPYPEAKNKIRKELRSANQKEALNKKTEELKEKYGVKLHLEFLSEVKVSEPDKNLMTDMNSFQVLQEHFKKVLERP